MPGENGERTLRLDGAISEETWWGDEVTPAAFKAELSAGNGNITVWINSPGGDVFAAAQIYNALKEYPGKVTIKIDGLAASAASVIAMAGSETLMSPVSYMVIHNPATIAIGDSTEMLKAKEMLDEIKEGIINAYEAKTGLSRSRISKLMTDESCFNAKKAVELGFADGVLYSEGTVEDESEPVIFSRMAVTNSLLSKLPTALQEIVESGTAYNEVESRMTKIKSHTPKPEGVFAMSKMRELIENRATKWEATKAFLESKRNDNGIVSAEDMSTYEKMEAEVMEISNQIDILERQFEAETKFSATNAIMPELPNPAANLHSMTSVGGAHDKTGRSSAVYNTAFWNAMRKNIIVSNDLAIGTDTQGGYLVPDEFHRRLIEALEEYNIMRRLCRVIRTSSGKLQIPVTATRGTAAWVDEAGKIPTSDSTFGQVTLSAYKLATMIKVSTELLNDSAFPLDSFLATDFGRRMGTLEEDAFIGGDGVKKPTGFLSSAQVGVTADSATAITFDDVMDLYHSLKVPYRNRAVFICNDLTIKVLRKLKDANGQYLWQPSVVAGTPDTVLGRPIHVSGYMPQIAADAKIMAFGDFSFYWIADRTGRTFDRLNEFFADTDQVGFKATQRVDGRLIMPEAVQVLQMGAS